LVCRNEQQNGVPCEEGQVRSNVRRFRHEQFTVWRCATCKSIHAADEVDLAHYYRHYPFHSQRPHPVASLFFNRLLGRLRQCGLLRRHSVLDYGCGGGLFVDHLRRRGHCAAVGYDAYSPRFDNPALLDRRYDCVFSQDVLEHVPDPWTFLRALDGLVCDGGLIAIGTPNAEAIDLADPESSIHALHQPYHRTIFSRSALLSVGDELGWQLSAYHPRPYADTWIPFLNARTWFRYSRAHDNTIDLAFERPRLSRRLLSPGLVLDGLFGSLRPRELDVMAIFRRGGGRTTAAASESKSPM
jgi:2-polyprenyl-3-methyl-5-hydroxy-6-metoxy-1,4-benzoquinol methylase